MPRKKKLKSESRRSYDDDFKAEAVQMLLDGHSAQSIVERLAKPKAEMRQRKLLMS